MVHNPAMHAAPDVPEFRSELDRLAAQFTAATLPQEGWTHEAHILVATWHLLHHDDARALELVRTGIKRLNAAHGLVETPTRGYHETITRFYLWAVREALATIGDGTDADAIGLQVVALCGDRALPFRYWSKERLMGAEARAQWVEPDLHPLT
jgi:hypothetical protein